MHWSFYSWDHEDDCSVSTFCYWITNFVNYHLYKLLEDIVNGNMTDTCCSRKTNVIIWIVVYSSKIISDNYRKRSNFMDTIVSKNLRKVPNLYVTKLTPRNIRPMSSITRHDIHQHHSNCWPRRNTSSAPAKLPLSLLFLHVWLISQMGKDRKLHRTLQQRARFGDGNIKMISFQTKTKLKTFVTKINE